MRESFTMLLSAILGVLLVTSSVRAHDSDPISGGRVEADHRGALVDQPRLGAHMSFGGGGEVEFDGVGASTDADSSLGFGFRFLHPLHTYFSVGAQLELLYARAHGMPERDPLLDLQAVLEARYPFRVMRRDVEAYFEMPIGLTILFPSDSALDNGAGVAFSLLFGARIWLTERLGLYSDLGWGVHHTYNDIRRIGGTVEPILRQMIFHIGAHLAL